MKMMMKGWLIAGALLWGLAEPALVRAAKLDDLAIGQAIIIKGENGAAYKFVKIIPMDDGNVAGVGGVSSPLPHSDGVNGSYWMLADNYCNLAGRPLNCMGKDTSGNTVPSAFQFWAESNADGNNQWSQMATNANSIYLRALLPFYNDLPDIIGGFDKDDMILTKSYPMSSIRSDGGDTTTYKFDCLLTAGAAIAITGETLAAADVANCVWPDKVSLPSYTDWQNGLNRYNVFAGSSSSANAYVQARFGKPWNSNIDDNGFTWKPWTRSANGWAAPNGREVWQIHGAQPDFAVHGEPAVSSFGVSPVLWLSSTLVTTGGSGTYADPYQIDDKTPPVVTDFSPTGEGVTREPTIVITFSEKIATTGKVAINGVTVTGTFDDDQKILTVSALPETLAYATTYTVNISGFKDTTGNQMVATSRSFMTELDRTPPVVTDFSPTGNEEPIAGTAVVTFSKPMNPTVMGEVTLSYGVGEEDEHIVTLSGGKFTSATTWEAPYRLLQPGKVYFAEIGGFRDAAAKLPAPDQQGNLLETDNSYSFETELADDTPPEILTFSPQGEGAPRTGKLSFSWSDPMNLLTYGLWKVTLDGQELEASAGAWSDGNMLYTLDYGEFDYLTQHEVKISGFQNWSGLVMTGERTFTFTTIPRPIVAITPRSAPAGNSGGDSDGNGEVCAMARAGAPTLIGAQRTSPTQATLFWEDGDGETTGWQIDYAIAGEAVAYGTEVMDAGARSMMINDLDVRTDYTFAIRQVNGCARSETSNQMTATPAVRGNSGNNSSDNSTNNSDVVVKTTKNAGSKNQASNGTIDEDLDKEATKAGELAEMNEVNAKAMAAGALPNKETIAIESGGQEKQRTWLIATGIIWFLLLLLWWLNRGRILIYPDGKKTIYVYQLDKDQTGRPKLVYQANNRAEKKMLRTGYGQFLVLDHQLNQGGSLEGRRVLLTQKQKKQIVRL